LIFIFIAFSLFHYLFSPYYPFIRHYHCLRGQFSLRRCCLTSASRVFSFSCRAFSFDAFRHAVSPSFRTLLRLSSAFLRDFAEAASQFFGRVFVFDHVRRPPLTAEAAWPGAFRRFPLRLRPVCAWRLRHCPLVDSQMPGSMP